jgi:hypothetical protein
VKRVAAFTAALCFGVAVHCGKGSAGDALPPDPGKAEFLSGAAAASLIEKDFLQFDPHYLEHREQFGHRLDGLARRISILQASGQQMECSNEIYLEAKWLYHYTADWKALESRLDDLEKSLKQVDQGFATEQSPETGLWGACYQRQFFKLESTSLALIQLEAMDQVPRFPIHFPAPFDSYDHAWDHFLTLLVSDIPHDGIDHRGELGNIVTVASLSYFKEYVQQYLNDKVVPVQGDQAVDEAAGLKKFKAIFYEFIDAWQDPGSGYWGPWYLSDGKLYKTADLSFTFHIISYRHGQVNHWPKIIDTTIAIENDPYPFGWKHGGELVNHNNYDLAKLFRYGWPHMSFEQKGRAATEIRGVLDWTLNTSLQEDGSFKTIPTFFSSVGADFYLGVAFLRQVGYWDPAKRFWTTESYPEAVSICQRIKARLIAMALESHESAWALRHLKNSC